jgi:cardiolipin synthase A/B
MDMNSYRTTNMPIPEDFGAVAITSQRTSRMLVDGSQVFPAMREAIERAQTSVDLASFNFGGTIGSQFTACLIRAARRGVKVRLLLDRMGSSSVSRSTVRDLSQAGVQFKWYRPLGWTSPRRLLSRNHSKILVCDNEVCFVGGIGLDDRWWDGSKEPRRDLHFEFRGIIAPEIALTFERCWEDDFQPATKGPHVERRANGSTSHDDEIRARIFLAVRSAERSLQISTAYFVPDSELTSALQKLASDGVEVSIIVNSRRADKPLTRIVERSKLGRLLRSGVRVFIYEDAMLHSKAIVVDRERAFVGSPNLNGRSLYKDREVLVEVNEPELVGAVSRHLDNYRFVSRELTHLSASSRFVGSLLTSVAFPIQRHL